MKQSKLFAGRWFATMIAALAMLLSGCGSDSTSTTSSTLSGTAATGAAIVGHIEITDTDGQTLTNVTINADGSYSADVSNMTAPFVVVAVPDDSNLPRQYSYSAAADVTVNITPLTSLALFLASGQQDLSNMAANWATQASQITANALQTAQAQINANFQSQFSGQGLDPTTYDFFSAAFDADGNGFDAVLDGLSISIDLSGGTFSVQVGGSSFSFDTGIDTSNINIGGGNSGGSGSLPAALASQIFTMEYGSAQAGSPYNDGDQVLFTFSSSGALFLTDQYTEVSSTFTVDSSGQYIWTAGDGTQYVVSLLNDALHEVNVMDSSDTFLGQFTPVSGGNSGSSGDEWNLTISGHYTQNIGGFDIDTDIGPLTLDGPFSAPDIDAVKDAVTDSYGASGEIVVLTQVATPTQKKFRVSFTGTVGVSETASYSLVYDYNKL